MLKPQSQFCSHLKGDLCTGNPIRSIHDQHTPRMRKTERRLRQCSQRRPELRRIIPAQRNHCETGRQRHDQP